MWQTDIDRSPDGLCPHGRFGQNMSWEYPNPSPQKYPQPFMEDNGIRHLYKPNLMNPNQAP
jgi:hypothetical protein